MKILLIGINAKYIHSNPAIYSLKACAGEYKNNIEIAEYTINQQAEDIRRDIYLRKPDVIALSCYIWNWAVISKLLPDLKKLLPEVPIWLGGPEVSYRAESVLDEFPQVTGIMVGEGEYTFYKVAEYYAALYSQNAEKSDEQGIEKSCHIGNRETDLAKIPGIVTRDFNTGAPQVLDLADIPFWYAEGNILKEAFENRIIYYETSRGCPFRCSYCLSSIDKQVRFRPMDMVKKELDFFLEHKVPQVKFIDRTFNCKHSHAMAIWQYIYEHDNGVTNFHFEIAADILNEEELELLAKFRPGQVQLEIGVQTTNTTTLAEIKRTTDMDKLKDNVARLRSFHNIHLHLDLIVGLPYENKDSFIRSFNDVYTMEPDDLQLGFLKVLSGSYIGERMKEYGILCEQNPPYEVLSTNWISYEDVIGLKRVEEMLELYHNSGQFVHTIAFLEKQFEFPFALYEALAQFYERKGFFVQAPSRSYRYEVLLDFACEVNADYKEVYRELLTYDLYLREKLKSRPVFLQDRKLQEDLVWNFYKKEEETPFLLKDYSEYTAKQMMHLTHLEYFRYPVWDMDVWDGTESSEYIGAVFFDYRKRNPITGNAGTEFINNSF
ncbi:MAG: B12-binding domain-containing radical SAM protein [Lachnospiraceae bacterium]|nr:B12-binding domain-containing radical SAM protein [Lachnospiraceae bacterium]